MPISQKLVNFLKKNKIKYEIIKHRQVFTAHDKAATLKVKPNLIGKTLILKIDNELALVLIPANKILDKNKFKKLINNFRKKQKKNLVKKIDFVSEKVMKNQFKGVKIGVIPPFGNLWKVATLIDRSILQNPKIIVNGGDYNFSIKIPSSLLKKITPETMVGNFSKSPQ